MSAHRACAVAGLFVGAMLVAMPAVGDVIFRSGFERGFYIETPEITVAPGEEGTYCYFVRTPNTGATGIRRWSSTMRPNMHHLIVYAIYDSSWQMQETHPSGTLIQGTCLDTFTGRMYAAHDPGNALTLPDDDGGGMPLAFDLQPGQPIAIEMYVPNVTGEPLTTSAVLQADTLADGAPFTRTASYQTINISISIPPNSSLTVTKTCAVPPSAKFWWLSTRTPHFATVSTINDAATVLVANSDWEHPGATVPAPPGYVFSSGLTYSCSYTNQTSSTVSFGASETTDELCVGIGFFFPATHPSVCMNDTGPL